MWFIYLLLYTAAHKFLPIELVVIIWATHVLAKLQQLLEKGYMIK